MDKQTRLEIDAINRRLLKLEREVLGLQLLIGALSENLSKLQQPLRDPARVHTPL